MTTPNEIYGTVNEADENEADEIEDDGTKGDENQGSGPA
jgi:hypothetical protein